MSIVNYWHPSLILVISCIIGLMIPKTIHKSFTLLFAALAVCGAFKLREMQFYDLDIFGYSLKLLYTNNYSFSYIIPFSLANFLSLTFCLDSKNYNKYEITIAIAQAASSCLILTVADYLSFIILYIFNIVCSFMLIGFSQDLKAKSAKYKYLALQLLSIIMIIAGIYNITLQTRHYNIIKIGMIDYNSSIWPNLILFGLLINIGLPLLYSWMAKCYMSCSYKGSLFLSIFSSNISAYIILTWFEPSYIFSYIGVFLFLYGSLYGLLKKNLRKIVSYLIISQYGLALIAFANTQKSPATLASLLLFAQIFANILLFMVIATKADIDKLKLEHNNVNNFILLIFRIIGYANLIAFPYTIGFISKIAIFKLIDVSWLKVILMFGVMLTLCQIYNFLIFAKFNINSLRLTGEIQIPFSKILAMIITALFCIIPGLYPKMVYNLHTYGFEFQPNELETIGYYIIFLIISILISFYVIRRYILFNLYALINSYKSSQ